MTGRKSPLVSDATIYIGKWNVRTSSTVKSQVQGAKVTTSHWTHVTEGCNNKPLQPPPPLDEHEHCRVHNAAIYHCNLHVFFTSPYRGCTNCGIMHYNGARAGPGLVDCGGGCSCLLLLHPSPTLFCADADVCILCFHSIKCCKYILDHNPLPSCVNTT